MAREVIMSKFTDKKSQVKSQVKRKQAVTHRKNFKIMQ